MNSTSQAPAFSNKDNTIMSNEVADYLWHHEFTIPEENTFSGSAQRAFTTGVITSKAKREIIQVLRTMMIAHTVYPTSEQYTYVSQLLISKYPKLKGPIGNGYVSALTYAFMLVRNCN